MDKCMVNCFAVINIYVTTSQVATIKYNFSWLTYVKDAHLDVQLYNKLVNSTYAAMDFTPYK